jgi:hypothetical protein
MDRPDSYQLHLRARAHRARHMGWAARRALRATRRWVMLVLFRPLFDPAVAQ